MTMQRQQLKRFIRLTQLHVPLDRDVFTYLGACFGIGMAVSLLLITLVLLLTTPAHADGTSDPIQHGTLFTTTEGASERRETPLLHTDVQFKISGLMARAHVTQLMLRSVFKKVVYLWWYETRRT
jgi:hypothetical protein